MEMATKSLWLVQLAVVLPAIASLVAMHRNTRSRWHVQLMGPAYIILILSHAWSVWFTGASSLSPDKLLALAACGLGNATLIKMAFVTNRYWRIWPDCEAETEDRSESSASGSDSG